MRRRAVLTPAELAMVAVMAEGVLLPAELAERLGLAESTAYGRRSMIMYALGVDTPDAVVPEARRRGLLPPAGTAEEPR